MRRMDTEDAIAAAGFEKRVQEFAFRKAQREDKVNAQADTHTRCVTHSDSPTS